MSKTVMIIAGEASGDLHGSEIFRRLQAKDNDIRCIGMGSDKMREAGIELLYDCADIAVVGLWEVLTHWPEIKQAMRVLKNHILHSPPDLLLLIDYQEFNLRLAKFAKQRGVKVLFYVSPQLWAWRKGRIRKFVNRIDMMAVIFPFEIDYYEKAGIPVRYVGHPLTNKVHTTLDKTEAIAKFGLDTTRPVVGLLPGSRRSEISKILPILLAAAREISIRLPAVQFLLPAAGKSLIADIKAKINEQQVPVKICENNTYNAIGCCSAAIVASGTATLEAALLGVPMVIVYRVAPFTYAVLSRLISVHYIGLANIVAGQQVAPEYVQKQAQPNTIAKEIIKLIQDKEYSNVAQSSLQQVRKKLGDIDGVEGISQLVLDMLHDSGAPAVQTTHSNRA